MVWQDEKEIIVGMVAGNVTSRVRDDGRKVFSFWFGRRTVFDDGTVKYSRFFRPSDLADLALVQQKVADLVRGEANDLGSSNG